MAAAVLGMPQEEETVSRKTWREAEIEAEQETHYRSRRDAEGHHHDLGMCHLCGGPLVDGLCARQIAHGSCEARVFSKADMGRVRTQEDPPRDLASEALMMARGEFPDFALQLKHLKAIVELLDQRNETIRELLKP